MMTVARKLEWLRRFFAVVKNLIERNLEGAGPFLQRFHARNGVAILHAGYIGLDQPRGLCDFDLAHVFRFANLLQFLPNQHNRSLQQAAFSSKLGNLPDAIMPGLTSPPLFPHIVPAPSHQGKTVITSAVLARGIPAGIQLLLPRWRSGKTVLLPPGWLLGFDAGGDRPGLAAPPARRAEPAVGRRAPREQRGGGSGGDRRASRR